MEGKVGKCRWFILTLFRYVVRGDGREGERTVKNLSIHSPPFLLILRVNKNSGNWLGGGRVKCSPWFPFLHPYLIFPNKGNKCLLTFIASRALFSSQSKQTVNDRKETKDVGPNQTCWRWHWIKRVDGKNIARLNLRLVLWGRLSVYPSYYL